VKGFQGNSNLGLFQENTHTYVDRFGRGSTESVDRHKSVPGRDGCNVQTA